MNYSSYSSFAARWSLQRVLFLTLINAFVGLMVDIRVEHVAAVREHSIAWLPIIYCGFMAIACLVTTIAWSSVTRLVMLPLFFLAFVIGAVGFYLHNHGDVTRVISSSIHAWTDATMKHPHGPPQIAPLAFAGLGVIGILASLKRFGS